LGACSGNGKFGNNEKAEAIIRGSMGREHRPERGGAETVEIPDLEGALGTVLRVRTRER
jgi:hypothetical protein